MSFTAAALNAAVDAIVTLGADRISAHTADPGLTGASEVTGGTYARQTTSYGAASGGARTGSQVTIPIPAGTTVTHVGCWSSGGTFRGGVALSSSQTFTLAGNLLHTPTLAVS